MSLLTLAVITHRRMTAKPEADPEAAGAADGVGLHIRSRERLALDEVLLVGFDRTGRD